jgi:hypothetical protein
MINSPFFFYDLYILLYFFLHFLGLFASIHIFEEYESKSSVFFVKFKGDLLPEFDFLDYESNKIYRG